MSILQASTRSERDHGDPVSSLGVALDQVSPFRACRSAFTMIANPCYDRIMNDFLVLRDILLFAEASGSQQHEPLAGITPTDSTNSPDEWRELVAERLRTTAEIVGFYGHDPLLTTLAGLRRQRHDLDAAMRRLLAYGREFTRPRPYRLADLADAAGMSISGVRTAYDADEIRQVSQATGLTPAANQPTTDLSREPSNDQD
jgi:hypothetical protein